MATADRVQETTTTTGTGAISMGGAVAGYRAFSAAFSTGDQVPYVIDDMASNWEVGIGTLTSGSPWTLARTTVLASTNAGAPVNFAAGTKYVWCDAPAVMVGREALTANRTYYVATTGSNSNTGLSAGSPFLTIQKAWDTIAGLDLRGRTATIQLADGTYTAGLLVTMPVTTGLVAINGNSTTPANVIVSTTSINAISVASLANVTLSNFEIRTTTSGQGAVAIGDGAVISIGTGMRFGACALQHLRAEDGGRVTVTANYTISGGATSHFNSVGNGVLRCQSKTLTISGTPAFSAAFAESTTNGTIIVNSNTFSGAATGIRYNVATNGVVHTSGGGATYLPGDTAGTTATGGQYA